MKTVKKLKKIIFIFLFMALLLLFCKVSKAETFQPIGVDWNRNYTKATFKSTNFNNKSIWQYTQGGSSSVTTDVFCVKEGASFYGKQTYTGYDLYDTSKKSQYDAISKNYNKIMWVVDHIYISHSASDSVKSAVIRNLKSITNGSVDSQIDAINKSSNRDALFFEIGQCLLWTYSSNTNNIGTIQQIKYDGKVDQNATDVFNALKKVADGQGNYTSANADGNADVRKKYINSLSFDNSGADINGKTAGPFVLNNYNEKYNLGSTWTVKVNGTQKTYNTDYSVRRDGNKFYIDFKSDLPGTCTIQITLNQRTVLTRGNYWKNSYNSAGQPLISIRKEMVSKDISTTVSQSASFYVDVTKLKYPIDTDLEFVSGAQMTLKYDDQTITKTTGSDWGTFKTGEFTTAKTFTITEDKAPNGYVNMLEGLTIKVTVARNNGSFSASRKVFKGTTDVTSQYGKYVSIYPKKNDDDTLRVGIAIKDPETIDYNFRVIKKSKTTNDGLRDAKFNLYGSDKTTLKGELVTAILGYSNAISFNTKELNKDLEKLYLKETEAPKGYENDNGDEFIEIQPHIDEYGEITINEINTDTVKTYVTTMSGVQTIVVEKYDSPKTTKYGLKIVKVDAKTGEEIKNKDFDIRGYIVDDCPDRSDLERYSFKFSDGPYSEEYEDIAADEDLTPIWISEISAPEGYINSLDTYMKDGEECYVFAQIIPHIDKDGKLTIKEDGINGIFFVPKSTQTLWGFPRTNIRWQYIDAKVETIDGIQTIVVTIKDEPKLGNYNLEIIKTDEKGNTLENSEATFSINGTAQKTTNGKLSVVTEKAIEKDKQEDTYEIEETIAPDGYERYTGKINVKAIGKETNELFELDTEASYIEVNGEKIKMGETSKDGYVSWDIMGNTITINLRNKYPDLALRKFITKVNEEEITNRVPDVDITPLVDKTDTTATYRHPKDPVLVHTTDIVTYTIRVYNEGTMDAFASLIKDDIPEGLEFVTYTEGDGSTNDTYKWKLVDENDNEVTDPSKAKYIVTDYLSKANGEKLLITNTSDESEKNAQTDATSGENNENGSVTTETADSNSEENPNLLKAFDPETMDELDYRDVKVQFKVTEPTTSDRIIINQAQIAEDSDKNGNDITDRDSTPNEWKGEDDEDIEKVRVLYFDLALRKWVTQAIVTENGQTQVTETGHKAEDDPEEVVKVDLKKSKINNVTVKFKYSIRITNEGEIAGEAKEIRDDVPQGLKFVAEDNPDWREENGQIVTNKLAGTTLQPGESAEVEILLTWVNSKENMGVMINTAEINKDHNEYGTPDIDSTPGNNVPGEDDIDDAPVMLTVKTGSEIIMIGTLGLGIIAIIGVGIVLIKKNVLIR